MSSRITAIAVAAIVIFLLLTAWVPTNGPVYFAEGVTFGFAILWLAFRVMRRGSVFLHPWLAVPLFAAALGVWQLASGHTVYAWKTWESTLGWAACAVLMFLGLHSGEMERLLRGFVYFGFGLCVFSVIQLYTSDAKVFWHFTTERNFVLGTLGYKNHFAAFVELLLPVTIWQATQSRNRIWYLVAAGIIAATTVAAASRAGVALVVCELVACLVMMKVQGLISWRYATVTAIVFTLATASFVGVFDRDHFERRLKVSL